MHPLLGRPLVQLGYDRDFGLLRRVRRRDPVPRHARRRSTPGARSALDPDGGLRIPEGTALDLGATGKAWCADLIATAFERHLRGSGGGERRR